MDAKITNNRIVKFKKKSKLILHIISINHAVYLKHIFWCYVLQEVRLMKLPCSAIP